jgi:hypothetical protein
MAVDAGSVVAAFPRPDQAKAAMVALERGGVAHRDVRLLGDGAYREQGSAMARGDDRMVGWLMRRWVPGALVGAVVGALVFVGVLALLREGFGYPIWIGAAAGGAVAGAFVGGFIWVGIGLPRNPRAWDTYLLAHQDEACVAVRLRRADAEPRVAELLRGAGATSIELLGGGSGRRVIL